MKIIFSNYDDVKNPYYGGGGAFSIHAIAKRLVSKYDVIVITGKYPGSKNEERDGVYYERIGVSFGGPQFGQALYQILLPLYVLRKKFDVWFESFTPPFSTTCLQIFTRKPVIGVIHLLAGREMARRYKLPFHWLEYLGLKTYKNIVALTENLKEQVRYSNKKVNISIIPNGLDNALLQRGPAVKDNYILFLGRIDFTQKGLDLLLESFFKIKDLTTANLIIAGSGEQQEVDKLNNLTQKLNLSDRVQCVGRVEGQTKDDLLDKSIVVVMPSRFEAMGIVALEAFCVFSPLVVFDIPSFEWVPKDCALKVGAYDTDKLAQGMLSLLNDATLRDSISSRAKSFVQKFNWEKITSDYNELIVAVTKA